MMIEPLTHLNISKDVRSAVNTRFSPYSVGRAMRTLAKDDIEPVTEDVRGRRFLVQSLSSAGQIYKVQALLPTVDEVIPTVICSCANGSALGGSAVCYHAAAVILYLAQRESTKVSNEV